MTMSALPRKVAFARQLRRTQTLSEQKLWQILRSRQFSGLKFRRQQPMGPYIADFYCPRARLVIELDGSQHQDRREYDQTRTDFLEQEGYRVLRFWDNEVFQNPEGVSQAIYTACRPEEAPSPRPSPQKGEGGQGRSHLL